jgi:hemerythrin-like metal-binding protein
MMREAGYPDVDRHCAEHRELARQVEELRRAYRRQGSEGLTDKVLALMQGWLTRHILEVDMRYRDYFRALGA